MAESDIYQSRMTNPSIFQIASIMSSRYCHFAQHAYLKITHVLDKIIMSGQCYIIMSGQCEIIFFLSQI